MHFAASRALVNRKTDANLNCTGPECKFISIHGAAYNDPCQNRRNIYRRKLSDPGPVDDQYKYGKCSGDGATGPATL